MKILLIHAEKFMWRVREKAKVSISDTLTDENEHVEIENVLVAFTTFEKEDEKNVEAISKRAVENIIEVAERINVKKVVLYPYAHLSKKLGKPTKAIEALDTISEKLSEKGYEVIRSPFGYYKEFLLHCKGHPLAESLREINMNSSYS